ncbi:hypothetical protein MTR67_035364 [Solanum verrucosum]|uniref:F-box domain-containing protein n=1 Tax=Solanum verrucosum TaxID=315347 RepID=A0AAF0UA20_SOLVR|nr:hypothetical protein MTR67_035364 [Solanum verrucosum]
MKSATISNLPCNVLDKILGSLPLKDAVKTSILSKDWRYKWVTRAELDFCSEFFTSFNNNQEAKKIIYQVLRLHQGPILKFTLQHPNLICYRDIYNWMLFLSKKNVQELTLQIFTGNKYHLPSYLFTFQQLRHLDLDMCFFHPPPDFKGFAKFISINLQHVIFDPTIFKNLITKCPLLESFMLTRCTAFDVLEIDAPNLYLITSCPKLQELTIECFFTGSSRHCGAMKLVKSVEMRYFIGFEMEIEFVKFILASAPVLKEIFIWSSGQFHRGTQMMDEIKQFHRESPNVRFKFEEM